MTQPDAHGLAGGEEGGAAAGRARADQAHRRRRAARAADASLRLEGLKASDEAKALGERWIRGELTTDELIEETKAGLTRAGLLAESDG